MKKTLLTLAILTSTTGVVSAASNASPFYFELQAGGSLQKATSSYIENLESKDPSAAVNFGYDFNYSKGTPLRLELSYAYRPQFTRFEEVPNSTEALALARVTRTSMQSLMANIYFDFLTDSAVSPYVTAGYGMAFAYASYGYEVTRNTNGVDTSSVPEPDWMLNFNPAWTAGAGVNIRINSNWKADIGAKYIRTGKVFVDNSDKPMWNNMESTDIMLGMRYNF